MKIKDFDSIHVNCEIRITHTDVLGNVTDLYCSCNNRRSNIPKELLNREVEYITISDVDGCLVLEVD